LQSQPEYSRTEPPEPPSEPILTLPGALTAYIALIAAIHLRVLLPPELENWTIDVFGFIPKRYDATLLNIPFPGGTGAKIWTFVTYSLLHANSRFSPAKDNATSNSKSSPCSLNPQSCRS
jgi:membrane associated rhomboid family serine protease